MISYEQRRRMLSGISETRPAPASDGVVDRVLALLGDVLQSPDGPVSSDRNFAELGLSSLLAVRFLDQVNRSLGLKLGVETLFSHSTPASFTAFVAGMMPAAREVPRLVEATPVAPASSVQSDAIAVIGLSGRFASADSASALWKALQDGRSLMGPMPDVRRRSEGAAPVAGFMPDAERFDASFFGISPREAASIDPTQRLFLQEAWRALESAGLTRKMVQGRRIGVFAGAAGSGYSRVLPESGKAADAYALTGNLASMTAARIAYFLNLKGPALTIDTACSSSLVAVHLACEALRRGEAEIAIAGGVSLFVDEQPFAAMQRASMLSPSQRCRPFDIDADGIMVGEAAGLHRPRASDRGLAKRPSHRRRHS